ncbi:MAG: hypothetical protein AAFN09_13465 [Pseudomonadota bacterium]
MNITGTITLSGQIIAPPSLSGLSAAANGATGWVGSVTTDTDNGTLFYLISSSASESDAAVKAGQSRAVNATGAIPLSGGGLSAETTYYLHVLHRDSSGNDSAQPTPVSFTTGTAGVATGALSATLAKATNPAVAPMLAHFDLSVSGGSLSQSAVNQWDPTHQGYVYITDWDDPGAVSDKVRNVPTQWNDLNVSYGKHPAHVYTSPGTYNPVFRCYERDGTLVGETTATVVVNDPASIFSGNRTILIDPSNNGDNATYPGSQVFTSWPAAFNALRSLNQTGRVLFKRGTTTQITASVVPSGTIDNLYLGVWGNGARPVVELPNSNSIAAGNGSRVPGTLFNFTDSANYTVVLTGIDFEGPWNASNETGGQYRFMSTTMVGDDRRILIDNCKIDGFAWGFGTLSNGTGDMAECINNTEITNWGDYGVFQSSNRNDHFSIIGTAIHQKEDALMGGDGGKDFRSCQHGPIRFSGRYRTYFAVLDLFSRNGWFKNGGSYGVQPTSQPCIRAHFSTDFTPAVYPHTTFERIACEGGGETTIQIKDQNSNGSGGALNLLMDKVLIAATACTWAPLQVQWSGWTLRNALIFIPDQATRTDRWSGIFNDFQLGVSPRADNPVEAYNLTVVNLKTVGNLDGSDTLYDADIGGTALATQYTNENNGVLQVAGAPTEPINVDLSTNMPTVGGVWTSRFLGTRWSSVGGISAQLTMNTALASPVNLVKTAVPNASSPLINDATSGLTAYDDFYGTVRTGPRDRGAVER